MRIAKFTLDGYFNYGNLLQSYALQEWLTRYADTVETIWHTPSLKMANLWKQNIKTYFKWILNHNHYREYCNSGYTHFEAARIVKMYEFAEEYIKIRYDVSDMSSITNDYDYFVVGSDQVWNPYSTDSFDIQFLRFAPKTRRISYAASMGTTELPKKDPKAYIAGLNEMTHISVRETEAAVFLSKYVEKDITVNCDPTLLINRKHWESISKRPYWFKNEDKGNYVLVYILGDLPKDLVTLFYQKGLKIVKLLDINNLEYYFTSPQEWLYLIKHAAYVVTDSFHGTCFSIIFGKPVYVFSRIGNGTFGNMNSRIGELLEVFDYSKDTAKEEKYRLLSVGQDAFEEKISELRTSAISYFNKAFDI